MEPRDQKLVIGLSGGLAIALLAIAFLLGRISSKPEEPVRTPASETAPAVSISTEDPAPAVSEVVAIESAGNTTPSLMSAAAPAPSAAAIPVLPREPFPVAAASTAPASASPDRPQIAAYFSEVDRLGDVGSGDPQAFAQSLMGSMTSGDFSGFDDLMARSRAQRDRLRAVTPPRACGDYHRLALTLSSDSLSMMERLKAALVKGDTSALTTLATDGRALEAQANQLKAMGEAIKRQAGL